MLFFRPTKGILGPDGRRVVLIVVLGIIVFLVSLTGVFIHQSGTFLVFKGGSWKPVITSDFPDPSIIQVGPMWFAFASQSGYDNKDIKVQLATSHDFHTWTLSVNHDALGKLAPWVPPTGPVVWAPSVSRRKDGKFLMYYSAITTTAGGGKFHCVGTAVSDTVEGPYDSNSDEPFACPTEQGGALDASAFIDPSDGTNYALYKVDGNSLGHGGSCSNGVEPIVKTPIMIQKVEEDGTTKIGEAVELISNVAMDGPVVEAPYMMRNADGIYVLFFSSNCYTTDLYNVAWATSTSPTGPFERSDSPLFATGTLGLIGPGGASVADDGKHLAMHGYTSEEKVGMERNLFVATIRMSGKEVLVDKAVGLQYL